MPLCWSRCTADTTILEQVTAGTTVLEQVTADTTVLEQVAQLIPLYWSRWHN